MRTVWWWQDPDVDAAVDMDGDEDGEAGPAQEVTTIKVTTKYMTKYERARILGTRALQIRCAGSNSAGRWRQTASCRES